MRRFIRIFASLLTALLLCVCALAQQDIISTVIGGGPNDIPALDANLNAPVGVAVDSAGNYYIAAYTANRVYKVNAKTLVLTVVAGIGYAGYSGDGVKGGAAQAFLNGPYDIAVDKAGNVYFSDYNNFVIRKVDTTNTITTIAGEQGQCNYNGDGAPATKFNLCHPVGIALDSTGADLYIGDAQNFRIRKLVLASDTISTFAGTGVEGFAGDGGPALSAELNYPYGIAIDKAGDVFIADSDNYVIREITKSNGFINTIAGTPKTPGFGGDGGAATSALINVVYALTVDSTGKTVTFPDYYNQRVRQFTVKGTINTVAGNGTAGFFGDGGAATSAELNYPQGIVGTSTTQQFLVADTNNTRIREFTVGSTIDTVAGNGSTTVPTLMTGVPPSGVVLSDPYGVFEDKSQNIWVSEITNQMVRELVHSTDLVDFFAGNGQYGYSGDGGPATQAELRYPSNSAEDSNGNVYIADQNNCLIREVSAKNGDISTFAGLVVNGSPQCGYDGDGGPAINAKLAAVTGVFVDSNNNVYIADRTNCVVREVSGGNISTIAGIGGKCAYGGDAGLAVDAFLYYPTSIATDPAGNIFIADEYNCRIREVNVATGIINTVAGNGGCSYTGDGPATQEEIAYPQGIAVDANDNLFIGDTNNHIVRWVSAGGLMTTIAGIPQSAGFNGDDIPATTAQLYYPAGVFEDPNGNYLIADQNNNRIRGVSAFAALSVAPGSLTFPLTVVGSTSNPQVVTLSALGPLTITNIQTSGDYSESDDCPGSLPNGQTCNIWVYFSPTAGGSRLGTITINDNAFFSPVSTVNLTGVGTAITLSGVPINFGNQLVKTTSSVQNVTITNNGTTAVTMGTITLNETTDFAIKTNNCPAPGKPLAGGAKCVLGMTFTPASTGFKKGAVIIKDNDPTSPQIAGVSGTGTSNVVLSPNSVNFGYDAVGVASAVTTITLINNTGKLLTLGNPALSTSGDFVVNKGKATTCTNNLQIAAGGNCAIGVQFKPTVIGYRTGSLIVSDNDPTSPQTVALTGIGISISFHTRVGELRYRDPWAMLF